MQVDKRNICINVLIHQDIESGKLVYEEHTFKSLSFDRNNFSSFFNILVFLNGGEWSNHESEKGKILKILGTDQVLFVESEEMLNIGKVRNICTYDYPISDYFINVDGDDEVTPDYFRILSSWVNKSDYNLIRFRFEWVNKDGSAIVPNHTHFSKDLMFTDYLPNTTYLINREWYINKGLRYPEDMKCCEDTLWSLSLHMASSQIIQSTEVIYRYRHDLSVMSPTQRSEKKELYDQMSSAIKYLLSMMYNSEINPEYHVYTESPIS